MSLINKQIYSPQEPKVCITQNGVFVHYSSFSQIPIREVNNYVEVYNGSKRKQEEKMVEVNKAKCRFHYLPINVMLTAQWSTKVFHQAWHFPHVIKISIENIVAKDKIQNSQIRVSIYLSKKVISNGIQGTYQSVHNNIRVHIEILRVR